MPIFNHCPVQAKDYCQNGGECFYLSGDPSVYMCRSVWKIVMNIYIYEKDINSFWFACLNLPTNVFWTETDQSLTGISTS